MSSSFPPPPPPPPKRPQGYYEGASPLPPPPPPPPAPGGGFAPPAAGSGAMSPLPPPPPPPQGGQQPNFVQHHDVGYYRPAPPPPPPPAPGVNHHHHHHYAPSNNNVGFQQSGPLFFSPPPSSVSTSTSGPPPPAPAPSLYNSPSSRQQKPAMMQFAAQALQGMGGGTGTAVPLYAAANANASARDAPFPPVPPPLPPPGDGPAAPTMSPSQVAQTTPRPTTPPLQQEPPLGAISAVSSLTTSPTTTMTPKAPTMVPASAAPTMPPPPPPPPYSSSAVVPNQPYSNAAAAAAAIIPNQQRPSLYPPPPQTPTGVGGGGPYMTHPSPSRPTAAPIAQPQYPIPTAPPPPPPNNPYAAVHPPSTTPYARPPPPPMPNASSGQVQYPTQQQQQQQQQQRPPPPQPAAYGPTQKESVGRPTIDSSQIPLPPIFTRPQEDPVPVFSTSATLDRQPPPADSRYLIRDDGNASPDVIRSSLYAFPATRGVWHRTGDLPMGFLCSPLAVHGEEFCPRPRTLPTGALQDWKEDPATAVPLVTGMASPPRCTQCQAYINPYFSRNGTCNLCGCRNGKELTDVLAGLPMQYGTVDFDVSGPYVTRSRPVEPIQLYAIDLTCPHLLRYIPILERLGRDMAEHFWRQPDRTSLAVPRIGIAFFSASGVAVPDIGASANHYQRRGGYRYALAADVTEEPCATLPLSEWTFDLSASRGLETFRAWIRQYMQGEVEVLKNECKGRNAYGLDGLELSCGGAALAFLADALADTGGRGTVVTWRRPNFGVGNLSHREERLSSTMQVKEDFSAYTPLQLQSNFRNKNDEASAAFYKKLAATCAKDRVALDVCMHTNHSLQQPFLDLATLGEVCRATCGRLMCISARVWEEALSEELGRSLQVFSGWDAVFKVRCSAGLQVKSFVSNNGTVVEGSLGGSPELELSCVTPSTCIAVELEHRVGGIPKESKFAFVQTALLYSTPSGGKRRVRVSTLAVRTTSAVDQVYRAIDAGAMQALLMRRAVARMRSTVTPGEGDENLRSAARDALYHHCIHILASYRQHTPAISSPVGQLVLPEKLRLFPLFCMCFVKSPALRPALARRLEVMETVTVTPSADERAMYNFHLVQVGPSMSMLMVHPNVFSVGNADVNNTAEWQQFDDGPESHGFFRIPSPLLPTVESLEDDGIYMLDSGLAIYLYIGWDVSEDVKRLARDPKQRSINPLVDRLQWQMRAFNSMVRGSESELRPTYAPLVNIFQQVGHQAPLETNVLNLMVDDAISGEKDYAEFLCTLYRRIRDKIGGGQ